VKKAESLTFPLLSTHLVRPSSTLTWVNLLHELLDLRLLGVRLDLGLDLRHLPG